MAGRLDISWSLLERRRIKIAALSRGAPCPVSRASSRGSLRILIRGRQLDGQNLLRFQNGHPAFTRAEALEPSAALKIRGPGGHPATTRVRAPGCYAYQVDGRSFTKLVVFTAELRSS